MPWLDRLRQGLAKTHDRLVDGIAAAIGNKRRIDDVTLEELEEILITGDIGVMATTAILTALQERVREDGLESRSPSLEMVLDLMKDEIRGRLAPAVGRLQLRDRGELTVILVMGVNGSGKTTTIAKLANQLIQEGRTKITFAAADTFRAAAIEQLGVWADRVGAELIKHRPGADPSAVAYDAVEHALKRKRDVLLIDTAGRLQTRHNLMEELKKINRVVSKRLGREIDERLLVIDATNGQNAISQVQKFNEAVPLTGIVLTKLDSTAKGGVIVPIAESLGIPVKLIGVGETAEDLHQFDVDEFVDALFERSETRQS
ncbi:MAG: signal recognition particle-docking protein FtsY [Candidatus Bipolaricaulia bacterium]